jgi:hypothetical protein
MGARRNRRPSPTKPFVFCCCFLFSRSPLPNFGETKHIRGPRTHDAAPTIVDATMQKMTATTIICDFRQGRPGAKSRAEVDSLAL